jgi:hypothetical protein
LTVVALVEKPVPVMVTTVPPARGPELGVMLVTVGDATADAGPTRRPSNVAATRKIPPMTWTPGKPTFRHESPTDLFVSFLALLCTLLPIRPCHRHFLTARQQARKPA